MRKLGLILLMLLLVFPLVPVSAQDASDNLLIATYIEGERPSLDLYDPVANTTTSLFKDFAYQIALLSIDGRLAFGSPFEGGYEVHLLDTNHPEELSTALRDSHGGYEFPLSWSPDGRSLAFTSAQSTDPGVQRLWIWDGTNAVDITPPDKAGSAFYEPYWSPDGRYVAFTTYSNENADRQIYVWDGKSSVNILPQEIVNTTQVFNYHLAWSPDGRLAFSIEYSDSAPSDIYLWDGQQTVNVSQNPTYINREFAWSADGQLAFLSGTDSSDNLLLWDGVTLKDGQPDKESFVSIAPEMIGFFSPPTWTSQNQLVFSALAAEDSNPQIYVWDGEAATNISQNPDEDNRNALWSADGRWVFTNNDLRDQFVYVKDTDNQSLLMTRGTNYFMPVWSSGGVLAFCRLDEPDWVLAVWDGQDIHEVARGASIRGQWQSGVSILCSSG
jgi:Tol biopolymer transport system component